MSQNLKTHKLGKLRIYLQTGEKIKSKSLLRKIFPKNAYKEIILQAKRNGIMNASVFSTHFGYNNYGELTKFNLESENTGLTLCIELIDTREKLEKFFLSHKAIFKDKVTVFKEVEFWDTE